MAANFFRRLGWQIIDVDRVGHTVLEDKRREIIEAFGKEIARDNGSIDRNLLGNKVFRDATAKNNLERILHPAMISKITHLIASADDDNIAINAALLFTMGLDRLCNRIIWLQASTILRCARALRRGKPKLRLLVPILWQQRALGIPTTNEYDLHKYSSNHKHLAKQADIHIVRNSGSIKRLEKKISSLL